MHGSKRRWAIAALLFVQAVLFGWGCMVTASFIVTRSGDPNLSGQLQLGIEQAAGSAVTGVLAVFILRGSRRALYATAAVATISFLIDLALATILLVWIGPLAILYLLFFPLPTVPLGVVAVSVLILSLSLIAQNRRTASGAKAGTPPALS
jgi:hypothetical protein